MSLSLVILRRQGTSKQQEREGESSRGKLWKKDPSQNYGSFHPEPVIRNEGFRQEALGQLCF